MRQKTQNYLSVGLSVLALGAAEVAHGEVAQVHHRATAPHLRLVGLGLAGLVVRAEVARLVVGLEQRQPLRPRLLPRLLARQRRRR